jgi:two-component system, NtrC family, response regulator AlgB
MHDAFRPTARDMSPPPEAERLHILVLDEDEGTHGALADSLAGTPHVVRVARTGSEALASLEAELFDVAFLDLELPDAPGSGLIAGALQRTPWLKIIVMTPHASVESAVEAVRAGAVDCLEKPLQRAEVRLMIEKLLAIRRQERKAASLYEDAEGASGPSVLTSTDPAMRRVLDLARRTASSTASIMLLGESGTGKGVLARAIHAWSRRADGPLSVVSCPSLSADLLRSELFGHERGAFTGAVRAHRGRIETTHGGTLFLDEVGDMPLSIQPKLLRFLQDRNYERVGSSKTRTADVRILTATNRDIRARLKEGEFREDLFYRLNVIEIWIPPLRERPADILPLARVFLHRFGDENDRRVEGFTADAEELLLSHEWPGNVRELRNAVERAVILCRGREVGPELLPGSVAGRVSEEEPRGDRPLLTLEQVERMHIRRVLEASGSVQEAAEILGISTTTLWRRRKKHEL